VTRYPSTNPPAPPMAPQEPPEPSFWEVLWAKLVSFGKALMRFLIGPGAALVVVVVAILLVAMGVKNVQIGGILGKLLGKKSPGKKAIDVANSVPEGRVDKDGKIIPQGEPDSKGMTQAVVVPIKDPGIFSNPDTVVFTPPGEEEVEIELPDGVKAKDVDKVVVVKPGEFAVTVKDNSSVSTKDVDDLLKKYR
jgi:hypothetical protein